MISTPATLLWIAPYRLKSRRNLNARSVRTEHEGVLLKDAEGGHACLHPWPELGDPPLAKCLEDLAGARRWPIVRRALRCLEMDGAARSVQDPLFEEMAVPRSHATMTGPDDQELTMAMDAGFDTVKLKSRGGPGLTGRFIERMAVRHPTLRWRIDFNETGEAAELIEWLKELPAAVRERIDFLEDPCPYAESTWAALWRETGVMLAVDREAAPLSKAAQRMVVKPAIDEPWLLGEAALANGQKVVVTSYMDHPLGQAFAAWEAARLELQFPGLTLTCGLQTHHLFEPDAFTEMLGPWSPVFQPPAGTGLGFDDLLAKQRWKRLV